jgi:CRP-like cAMP-binding protein
VINVFKQYLIDGGLTEQELKQVESVVSLLQIPKKEYFLHEGDVLKYYAFVTEGCFRTYTIDEDGNELTVKFNVDGMWAADDESLESGKPSAFNIDALEDSEVATINGADFASLYEKIPAFRSTVDRAFNESFLMTQYRIHELISLSAEDRYLKFLETYPQLPRRIPQGMIASYLRVTPETLSRVRKQCKSK